MNYYTHIIILPTTLKQALGTGRSNSCLSVVGRVHECFAQDEQQFDPSPMAASMKELGTDEYALIGILCSRTSQELHKINILCKEMYKTDLDKDIISDTTDDFHRLMVALAKSKRADNGSVIDYELIDRGAWDLYDAGVRRKGTDVPKWISIMTKQSVCHLQKVFERYKLESIKKEVKGNLENAFWNLVWCIQNKRLYFAG